MNTEQDTQRFVERMVDQLYGDRAAALGPELRHALNSLVSDVLWQEGIEALTPARLDGLLAHVRRPWATAA